MKKEKILQLLLTALKYPDSLMLRYLGKIEKLFQIFKKFRELSESNMQL